MSKADLAGDGHAASSTDDGGSGGGVVGSAKGGRRGRDGMATGCRPDLSDLKPLIIVQKRQDPRQTPGQHRLPGTGRTGEQKVVPTGGGYLQCPTGKSLPPHLTELDRRVEHLAGWVGHRPPRTLTQSHRNRFGERSDAAHHRSFHHRSLTGGHSGENARKVHISRHEPCRQSSARFAHRAVQSQLAEGDHAGDRMRNCSRGGQYAQRDRQVIRRSHFGKVGRGKIHGHPAARESEPGGCHGGPNPVLGFPNCRVGKAHKSESRFLATDVDLDSHRSGLYPDECH